MSSYQGYSSILGKTGTGKTTLERWFLGREFRANPDLEVYTNFKIYAGDPWKDRQPPLGDNDQPLLDPRVKRLKNLQAIQRIKREPGKMKMAILDQLGDWLGARNFGSEYNKKMVQLVGNCRKKGLRLMFADQYNKDTDIKVRNNVSLIYQAMGVYNRKEPIGFWWYESSSGAQKPFAAYDLYAIGPTDSTPRAYTDLTAEKIQLFFDSFEEITPQDQEVFRVKSHVKSVLKWARTHKIDFGDMTYGSKRADDYLIRFEEERHKILSARQRSRVRTEMDMLGLFKEIVRGKGKEE